MTHENITIGNSKTASSNLKPLLEDNLKLLDLSIAAR